MDVMRAIIDCPRWLGHIWGKPNSMGGSECVICGLEAKGELKMNDRDFSITPLGAAIVEALPDRQKVKRIRQRFEKHSECPSSALFDAAAVSEFYRRHGKDVTVTKPKVGRAGL